MKERIYLEQMMHASGLNIADSICTTGDSIRAVKEIETLYGEWDKRYLLPPDGKSIHFLF